MGKRVESRHGACALRRTGGHSFQAGRALGFNLGHSLGFEAGYDKGFAEGNTLGYNNGFLQALHLQAGEVGTAGEQEVVMQIVRRLAAAGAATITLSGAARREAAVLFALLGVEVLCSGENSGL